MLSTLSKLGLLKVFLLAILIRLILMPFFFHPDIKTYTFQSSFLKSGIFNIYTHLVNNREKLPLKEEFIYFPLTYFALGGYQVLSSPFLGRDFPDWLSDASAKAVSKTGVFRYLFILKLPYLILDFATAFLLMRFFKDYKLKRKAFILWLFNPFSPILIYIFSNIDIIPLALSLIAILIFSKKRLILSGLFLGLAIGFKAYPIIFVPFMLFFLKNFKDWFRFISPIGFVLLLCISPFWSNAFIHSALISSLTTRIVFPSIPIGFNESLMVGVISISTLYIFILINEKGDKVWDYLLAALLLIFSTIHYHIQWLLWIMPFVIIFHIIKTRFSKLLWIWLSLAFLIPLLYDDKSMSFSLFSAISNLYNLLPTPFLALRRLYDPYLLQGIIHSIMFSIAIIIVGFNLRLIKK